MTKKDLTLFTLWCWLRAKKRSQTLAGYAKRYRERHPERARESKQKYRKLHPEKESEYARAWKDANPDRVKAASRRYYLSHSDKIKARAQRWVRENRNRFNKRQRDWKRVQSLQNPDWRIKNALSARIRDVVSGRVKKVAGTSELLGCSGEFLRQHLQQKFLPGMTWENYGVWHIDHKRPCASFDLTDPAQQRVCFHYSNLQPLWGVENMKKGAKYCAS